MKAKKIIIAVVAILVVLGGTFAGLWFFTDVLNFMKPDKKTAGSVNQEATDLEKALHVEGARFSNYSEFLEKYEDNFQSISNSSYTSKMDITANLKISGLDSKVQDTINKSKISLESNVDSKEKRTQNKLSLSADNSEVLALDMVTNDKTIGIGCKDLYDKYITISLDDLVDYLKKNYNGSMDSAELESLLGSLEKMYSNVDPYELLYISKEDLQHFDETYRDGYKALISSDSYSTKKGVKIDVDGEEIKADAHYVTLTGKQFYEFVKGFGDIVKNDSVLRRVLTEKLNILMGYAGQKEVDEEDVKSLINDFIDSMVESMDNIADEEDHAVQLAIYTADDKTVRIDFNQLDDVKDMEDAETLASMEFTDSKNTFTLYSGKETISITNEIKKDSDEEKAGSFKVARNSTTIATLTYDIVEKEDESKLDLAFNIPDQRINFAINFETDGNYKEEEVTVKGSINFGFGSESVKLNFDGKLDATADVSVPELDSNNSINILKMSEEDLKTEMEKILKKASEVLPDRLKLLGIDVKAEDIYSDPNKATEEPTSETVETTEETESTDEAA